MTAAEIAKAIDDSDNPCGLAEEIAQALAGDDKVAHGEVTPVQIRIRKAIDLSIHIAKVLGAELVRLDGQTPEWLVDQLVSVDEGQLSTLFEALGQLSTLLEAVDLLEETA